MHSISASPSTSSELLHSRRLLLRTPVYPSWAPAPAPTTSGSSSPSPLRAPNMGDESSFDGNLVMILSVLLCALICIFGLIITMIRCPVRGRAAASNDDAAARLANTGVKRKALKTFPTVIYNSPTSLELPGLGTECSICLSEFRVGERLRILPKCNHGFHIKCIGKWLASHSSCPTCRHCLLDTCHKIVASTQPSSSNTPSSPLQPQDVEHCYPGLPRWLAR